MSTWENRPGSAEPDGGSGYGSEDKWALPPEYAAGVDSGSGAAPYGSVGGDGGWSPARSGVPVPVVAVGAVAILALAGVGIWFAAGSGGRGDDDPAPAAPASTTAATETSTMTTTATITETTTTPSPTSSSTPAPGNPQVTADAVSYDTGDSTILCRGSASSGYLTCQNMSSDWEGHNMVTFDLAERTGSHGDGDYDSANTSVRQLPASTKFSYNGLVVQGKGGTLYFSSPEHGTRGEITGDRWEIMPAG